MKQKIIGNKSKIQIIIMIILMILVIRASYAFYIYTKDSYDIVYNTGKIRMDLGELNNGITLSDQLPLSNQEGINQDTSYNFSVSGYTNANKPIYYDIIAIQGNSISGKTRFNDDDIKLYLTDDEDNILYGPEIAYKLSTLGTNMYATSIEGGSVLSPIVHNYKLKVWINGENILISRTTTSTTKNVYTPEEYNSHYFSIKIKITTSVNTPKYAGQNIVDIISQDLANNMYTPSGDTEQTFIVGTANDTNYNPNNYLWYSGKLWRIVALNKTDGKVSSIKLITQDNITAISWNGTLENGGSGNSVYENSLVYQWLNEDFYRTLRKPTDFIVNDYSWNTTAATTSAKPEKVTMVTAPVGLINYYEYWISYTNTNQASGYLKNDYSWYMITPSATNPSNVIMVDYTGTVYHTSQSTSMFGIRPSINLKSSIGIIKGDGTKNNPYRLVGDSDIEISLVNKLLNTRYSGEYVKFNNENYRIVQV